MTYSERLSEVHGLDVREAIAPLAAVPVLMAAAAANLGLITLIRMLKTVKDQKKTVNLIARLEGKGKGKAKLTAQDKAHIARVMASLEPGDQRKMISKAKSLAKKAKRKAKEEKDKDKKKKSKSTEQKVMDAAKDVKDALTFTEKEKAEFNEAKTQLSTAFKKNKPVLRSMLQKSGTGAAAKGAGKIMGPLSVAVDAAKASKKWGGMVLEVTKDRDLAKSFEKPWNQQSDKDKKKIEEALDKLDPEVKKELITKGLRSIGRSSKKTLEKPKKKKKWWQRKSS